jgi:hypothetical protein
MTAVLGVLWVVTVLAAYRAGRRVRAVEVDRLLDDWRAVDKVWQR